MQRLIDTHALELVNLMAQHMHEVSHAFPLPSFLKLYYSCAFLPDIGYPQLQPAAGVGGLLQQQQQQQLLHGRQFQVLDRAVQSSG